VLGVIFYFTPRRGAQAIGQQATVSVMVVLRLGRQPDRFQLEIGAADGVH
jgi:hypothetical protein